MSSAVVCVYLPQISPALATCVFRNSFRIRMHMILYSTSTHTHTRTTHHGRLTTRQRMFFPLSIIFPTKFMIYGCVQFSCSLSAVEHVVFVSLRCDHNENIVGVVGIRQCVSDVRFGSVCVCVGCVCVEFNNDFLMSLNHIVANIFVGKCDARNCTSNSLAATIPCGTCWDGRSGRNGADFCMYRHQFSLFHYELLLPN